MLRRGSIRRLFAERWRILPCRSCGDFCFPKNPRPGRHADWLLPWQLFLPSAAVPGSAWLRLRDVNSTGPGSRDVALVFHICAAVVDGVVVAAMTQQQVVPAIRILTVTCVFLLVFYCVFGVGLVGVAYFSLSIAGAIGAITLLLRVRTGSTDRDVAWLALLVLTGRVDAYFDARCWIAPPSSLRGCGVYESPIALLFLPTVAVLLMMLAGPDADSEETGPADAAETGAT